MRSSGSSDDRQLAEWRFSRLRKLYVSSAVVAAVVAVSISFIDGYGNGNGPPEPLPWYALGWDILYYVERAFVLYLLIVIVIVIATSAFVSSRWRAAYDEYTRSVAEPDVSTPPPAISPAGAPDASPAMTAAGDVEQPQMPDVR